MSNSSDSRGSDSGNTQGKPGGVGEFDCPRCGESVDRRGAHGHLTLSHGIDSERASELIAADRESGTVSGPGVSASEGPRSGPVAGVADLADDVAGEMPSDVPADGFGPATRHVQKRLADVADVAASQRMIEAMSSGGGDDRDGRDDEGVNELRREIRAVRNEVRESSSAQSGDGGGELATLAQLAKDGDVGRDEIATLAELGGVTDPEVKIEEMRLEREERKAENRRELINSAIESLESVADQVGGSVVETALGTLFGEGGGGRREPRREPAREPARVPERQPEPQQAQQPEQAAQPRGADPGRPVEGDSRIAQDGGQPAQQSQPESTTRQRFDEVRDSQDGGSSRVDVEPENTPTETEFRGEDPGEIDDGAEGADETDEADGETDEATQDETSEVDQ